VPYPQVGSHTYVPATPGRIDGKEDGQKACVIALAWRVCGWNPRRYSSSDRGPHRGPDHGVHVHP
jgi:hypothetical protein